MFKGHSSFVLLMAFGLVAAIATAVPAFGQNAAQDEATYREFEQIVSDFSAAERIQAWEAFIQKYPRSTYVPKVKDLIAELRGEKRAAPAPTSAPIVGSGGDPDLDFLDGPAPTPAPRPTARPVTVATPRPTPTPAPAADPGNPFLDSGSARPRSTASADSFNWGEGGSSSSSQGSGSSSGSSSDSGSTPAAPKRESFAQRRPLPPQPRAPRAMAGVGKASHTEVAVLGGFSPDEDYVQNLLVGVTATQRFGRTYGLAVEVYGASASETDLLRRLRVLGAEPEVISKMNFIAGGTVEANLLSAIDRITGQIPYRNELYVRAGGGIVNSDLEICKQLPGGEPCNAPLFIQGVNFGYVTGGAGYRFYATRWLTFRVEGRGRMVFELIDGEMRPRPNVQINLGPTFVF